VAPSLTEWVLLAYRLPRDPSSPRVGIWRKLRRLGALQLVDGLVALPHDERTREQLEWIADEILDAHGEVTLWVARPSSAAQSRQLAERLAAASAEEYADLIAAADDARLLPAGERERAQRRLRAEFRRVQHRDYVPGQARTDASLAIEKLSSGEEDVA
jgi:hypothetical protein